MENKPKFAINIHVLEVSHEKHCFFISSLLRLIHHQKHQIPCHRP